MKFRNYCIVAMGDMSGVKDDILKIAETKPRYLDATGILIATFASVAEPPELEDFFKKGKRSFFIFDLSEENSTYHLDNLKIHSHLFGHLFEQEATLNERSSRIMSDISASTSNTFGIELITRSKKVEKELKLSELTPVERQNMVNNILDKGFKNISDSDKKLIEKINNFK